MKIYENFISYRRDVAEGTLLVKNIYDELLKNGYDTFCDIYSLNSGQYGNEIFDVIDKCTNFVVVLTPNTFNRSISDKDWVYLEVKKAIQNKKNIIPIFFNKDEVLGKLPKELIELKSYNGIEFNVEYIEECIRKLVDKFLVKDDKDVYFENGDERDFVIDSNKLVKYLGTAKNVRIPNDVTIIGEYAFKDLTAIEKITLPNSLIEIEESAFERCRNLSFVEIPDTTEFIRKKAFNRCFNLVYIKLGKNVKVIEDYAFGFCNKLKRIEIPRYIENLSCTAFNNCSKLQEILVEIDNNNYSSIDGLLFNKEKSNLIRCPEGVKHNVIQLPNTVIEIGKWAFNKCIGIHDIIMPQGIKVVEEYAFKDCINIVRLTLVNSVEKFELSAIDGWSDEQQILYDNKFSQALKYKIEQSLKSKKQVVKNELNEKYMLLKTTFESENEAKETAYMLLEKKLITSGQIKKLHSIYQWNGSIDSEDEFELSCITETRLYYQIEEFIKENHSYELCQILCVPIIRTSIEFADWISNNLK